MVWGEIPEAVRLKLAEQPVRMFHALWHLVRNVNRWNGLTQAQRDELILQGWQAPRFELTPGAGIDFLQMHRHMIEMVNEWAAADEMTVDDHGDDHSGHDGNHAGMDHHPPTMVHSEDFVRPWITIPWDHADPVWPMPVVDLTASPSFPTLFGASKEQGTTDTYRQRVTDRFDNPAWLRTQTVDQLGTALERSIHGWMHMHWSTVPPPDPNTLDVNNDWLGSPFSSHVNRHFWKLHGWIDDRIFAWEDANGHMADLSTGWAGPPGEPHRADPAFFAMLDLAGKPPLLMLWDDLLLEQTAAPKQ